MILGVQFILMLQLKEQSNIKLDSQLWVQLIWHQTAFYFSFEVGLQLILI
jgi:hypothetical protein